MSLERATLPENPTSYATHLKEGYIMGVVPAEITNINDPLKLGRIRCRCDLIDPNTELPNGEDGWIPTGEEFTVVEGAGGSHAMLAVGAQVILAPILGKMDNWLYIKCLNSKIDRPSPEHDRASGKWGAATQGEVITVNDDSNQSAIKAYPHGVTSLVTAKGDTITQTAGGARTTLTVEGKAITETPTASVEISPEGAIASRNVAGVESVLDSSGEVRIKNGANASLLLQTKDVKLVGPASELGSQLQKVQKTLLPYLQKGTKLLETLGKVIDDIPFVENLEGSIGEALDLVEKLETQVGGKIGEGLKAIAELEKLPLQDFADAIAPQVSTVLNAGLDEIIPAIEGLLKENPSIAAVLHKVKELIPGAGEALEAALPILKSVEHDPTQLMRAITDVVVEGGLEKVDNLMSMGLHTVLKPLGDILSRIPELPELGEELDLDLFIKTQKADFTKLIPENIKSKLTPDLIDNLFDDFAANGDISGVMNKLYASVSKQSIVDAAATLGGISPILQGVGPAKEILTRLKFDEPVNELLGKIPGLEKLDPKKETGEVLKRLIEPLIEKMQPIMSKGFSSVKEITDSIPASLPGAVLELTQKAGVLKANASGAGAILEVGQSVGKLIAPDKLSSVFAGMGGGAGIASPFGSFAMSAAGGSFLTKGLMVMKVAQSFGKSAGLSLSPKGGIGLASFSDRDTDDGVQHAKDAEISVDQGRIRLRSHNSNGGFDGIEINEDGVFIEGIRVSQLIGTLNSRLAGLESLLA